MPPPLPLDYDDPLVFHVFTGLDETQGELLDDMIHAGGMLQPLNMLGKHVRGSMQVGADKVAGDGDYIFMTPCTTFDDGELSGTAFARPYSPAVAYRLSTLARIAGVLYFRPHDLLAAYMDVFQAVEVSNADPEGECDDAEDVDACLDAAIASYVSEELEEIAESGTVRGHDAVELVRLRAAAWAHHLGLDGAPPYRRLVSAVQGIWARHPPTRDPEDVEQFDDTVPQLADALKRIDALEVVNDFASHPEVLVRGELPLRAASWVRLGGEWLKMTWPSHLSGWPRGRRPAAPHGEPPALVAMPQRAF